MEDRSRTSLTLILPAYNEAAVISRSLAEAETALADLGRDHEILVVDDGSTDETAALVQQAQQRNPRIRLLRHADNQGYGAALRTGFVASRGELVAFTDADCQFHLSDLERLIALTQQVPIVTGLRRRRQDPWSRRFFSWGYNVLARTFMGTGVRDVDCALKVFRREAVQRLLPEHDNFFVNTEMFAKARQQGMEIAEVGVLHRPRLGGHSKVSLRDIPRTLRTFIPFWWSRVLFPGDTAAKRGESSSNVGWAFLSVHKRLRTDRNVHPTSNNTTTNDAQWQPWLMTVLLVLLAGLMFFTRLSAPLLEPDEARYAEIPRQMLAHDSYIVPVLHGQPYYHKPPLLYWLVMTSYRIFGVHDWAARLVPGTAGVLLVLLIWWWGRPVLGQRAAFLSALLLCVSARFLYLGRMLTMDSVLCLCVVAALLAAWRALCSERRQLYWWLISAVLCGMGLLTKGPVALVLVAVPILLFTMLDQRVTRPTLRAWGSYLAISCGIALPWYLSMAWYNWHAFVDFFWIHHVTRFVQPLDHAEPFWFFLPSLLLGMLPWSLLLIPLAKVLWQRRPHTMHQRTPALGFFLLAFGWCVLFYSCSGCKRPVYILPALPLLMIALGSWLSQAVTWQTVRLGNHVVFYLPGQYRTLAHLMTLTIPAIGIGLTLLAVFTGLWNSTEALLITAIFSGLLAVGFYWIGHLPVTGTWLYSSTMLLFLLWLGIYQLLPDYNRRFALRGDVRPHVELCQHDDLPVVCYPRRWDSVSFYLQRNDVRVYSHNDIGKMLTDLRRRPRCLVFIKRDGSLRRFLAALPAELEFVPYSRQRNKVAVGFVRPRWDAGDRMWEYVSAQF